MATADQPFELEELLLRVLSHEATQEETAALDAELRRSPELRAEAFRFLCDDSLLAEHYATERQAGRLLEALRPEAQGPDTPRPEINGEPAMATPATSQRLVDRVNRHGVAIAAAAAMIIVALGIYTVRLNSQLVRLHQLSVIGTEGQLAGQDTLKGPDADAPAPTGQTIGRVAGLSEVIWVEGARKLKFGDKLREGDRIALESGVVELLLSTGAKVTIEGPAELDTQSASQTLLTRGKLAAAAPRTARGYTVITPTAELVDIGTQFGVMVDAVGDSELHVFDGDVVARSLLPAASADLLHAKQDQAMRFDSSSAEPTRFAARAAEFIRHVTPVYDPDDLPPIPSSKDLAVWYAADKCNQVSDDGRVGTWNDLLVGDNDFADNAWQFDEIHRPRLVEDGAGRKALAFDGWSSYMVTSPIDATAEQTTFMVVMPAPISYSDVQMLLKYAEAPSLELTLRSNASLRGWVWPGPDKANVGEVNSATIDNSKPLVLAYQYDTDSKSAKLWLNGALQGTAEASVPLTDYGQTYLGRHSDPNSRTSYFGNMYEVIVFNKTFDESELKEFWTYFSTRYNLE